MKRCARSKKIYAKSRTRWKGSRSSDRKCCRRCLLKWKRKKKATKKRKWPAQVQAAVRTRANAAATDRNDPASSCANRHGLLNAYEPFQTGRGGGRRVSKPRSPPPRLLK